jgi:hypothetical protein
MPTASSNGKVGFRDIIAARYTNLNYFYRARMGYLNFLLMNL